MAKRRTKKYRVIRSAIILMVSSVLVATGGGALWVATLKMPDLNTFDTRVVAQSTKIYDRTGTILLYDINTDAKRTVVPLSDISPYIQKATVAIEDSNFYTNIGIEPTAILRAFVADIFSGGFSQGASTITQQVVKNSLLTQDKTITRKIKELILSIKLTRMMSKDQILQTYLNESPYGGTIYGVEEASQSFFGKPAKDDTLAEAAYLAAIPQAPTYYSPYGLHLDDLKARQRLVLQRMKELNMISADEYNSALAENVKFLSKNSSGIRAPHFVMMVRDYLAQKYGEDAVNNGGLRVITTLNMDMQQKMEQTVAKFAPTLAQNYNASNTAMVAIDPKTGDVLALMGSRDYFDPSIDGNYNVALGLRQPGSTFKPFVYATAFKKGYTPDTALFDVRTEFSTKCTPDGKPINPTDDPKKVCYSPDEYDNNFEGPMTMRFALAQSRNIPAVKTLYLAGIPDSIQTAKDLGITTLTDPNRYGLTLVLGGGEVRLIDMVSAYGVFADDGVRNPWRTVLEVDDANGNVLEKATTTPSQVLDQNIAREISDILSDNKVRMTSLKPIANSIGRQVALKTGTTNDYRDVWTIGYTPNLVVGAWAGNSDNTPMSHNIAGLIITPLWGAYMDQVARDFPPENFQPPEPQPANLKPTLRGIWQGGISYWKDKISGKVATEYTPNETKEEVVFNSVHSILKWVDPNNPTGPIPEHPEQDPQFANWEYGVRDWFKTYQAANPDFKEASSFDIPTATDDVHTPEKAPKISVVSPANGTTVDPQKLLSVQLKDDGAYPPQKTDVYVNGKFVLSDSIDPLNFSFVPADVGNLSDTGNTLSVILYDSVFNKDQAVINFSIKK
ncbi:penicillin-binding protein [Patescibacteria group bacterium]|nr:penicillin-binding protein [Patescibacteria group bacterium]MDE1946636.1 penicillin-binding protein [Patescibacteria group bacterium]MDE2010590.1 penicillin-binding protein [Patescibacteria group bacterium]MDE2233692.1 penicillin-binding protein [Patescibacteria group bacterium]